MLPCCMLVLVSTFTPLHRNREASSLEISRRSIVNTLSFVVVSPCGVAGAVLTGASDDELAKQYVTGARGSGGRGANAMLKTRAVSGVERIGGDPKFKRGSILDAIRSEDGSIVCR